GGFAPSHRRSIAITSFLVSNGGGDHMTFVDEIKRRLAHVLIKEGYFRVLGASQQPAATAEPRPNGSSNEAAPEFPKADYLLEGIVEIHDQRIRLILQLQNVMDGSYSWSESAECDFNNLSNIEALARAVNRELLTPRNEAARAKIHGEHKQSYDSYVQGRYYWKLATPESVRSSVASFQKASESNPAYA